MEHGKEFLIFFGGMAIGGICAWFFSNSYYKEKYSKELENRWATLKQESNGKSDKIDAEKPKSSVNITTDISKTPMTDYKNLAKDYSSYYNRDENEKYDLDQSAAEQEHPSDEDHRPPYEIDSEEAGYGLDLNTVTFYTIDEVLADDLTNEMLDVDNTIGEDGVKIRLSSDEDAVYIRNETLGIDYEVLISHTSYAKFMEECNGFTD